MERASIYRIAELAKVSIGTVDRALHGRAGISEATRKKVLRIAKRIEYTPHLAARTLSTGRSSVRIGVCIPKEIHFYYDQMRAGILDEARRSNGLGVEIDYRPAPIFGKGEKDQVAELLDSGVSAIIVTPGDPSSVTPVINRAEKQNVRVICTTTDAPRSHRTSVVCVNPEVNGQLAAELMSKFVAADAKVAVITGMLTSEDHRAKTEAFLSGFKKDCPGGEVISVLEAHESEGESYRKTCELLEQRAELRGIYVNTVNCLPVCRALRDLKRAGDVHLITSDLFREMVPYFKRGTIRASIYQDPFLQGQTAVRVLVDHLLIGTAIPGACYLNPGIVLRSNLSLFREAN
jgi:LacI family transcriptional regulator